MPGENARTWQPHGDAEEQPSAQKPQTGARIVGVDDFLDWWEQSSLDPGSQDDFVREALANELVDAIAAGNEALAHRCASSGLVPPEHPGLFAVRGGDAERAAATPGESDSSSAPALPSSSSGGGTLAAQPPPVPKPAETCCVSAATGSRVLAPEDGIRREKKKEKRKARRLRAKSKRAAAATTASAGAAAIEVPFGNVAGVAPATPDSEVNNQKPQRLATSAAAASLGVQALVPVPSLQPQKHKAGKAQLEGEQGPCPRGSAQQV